MAMIQNVDGSDIFGWDAWQFTEEMAVLTVSTARISSIEGAVLLQQKHLSAGQADAFSFVVIQVSGRMMWLVQFWVQNSRSRRW